MENETAIVNKSESSKSKNVGCLKLKTISKNQTKHTHIPMSITLIILILSNIELQNSKLQLPLKHKVVNNDPKRQCDQLMSKGY